jgi:hypothetical protein
MPRLAEGLAFRLAKRGEKLAMEVVIAIILAASALIGFVVRRWWAVLVPIAAFGLFYAGLNAEWWGNGVGDGWQYVMAFFMVLGALAAGIGVLARTVARRRAERPSPSQARG